MIDVDSQNGREQVADVLPGLLYVGRVGANTISRGNVEIAIGPEFQTTSVVTSGQPGNDRLLARRVDRWRIRVCHAKPRDVRSIFESCCLDVTNVAIPVVFKVGMKSNCVDLFDTCNFLGKVNDEVGRLHIGAIGEGEYLARLFDDKQTVAARCVSNIKTLVKFECRKGELGHVG